MNGDYSNGFKRRLPKQTEAFEKQCPPGVTNCITVSGKIASGDQN